MIMISLNQAALPQLHLLLRSVLRRDRRPLGPNAEGRRRRRRRSSVVRLVGHLTVTSLVFLALITLVWIVSSTFHFMHSVYPFPDETFRLLDRLKMLLVYGDVAVSGIVLLNGFWHYIVEVIRGDS